MNQQAQLLDAVRKTLDCNDRELADRLATGKSQISEYRAGTRPMTDAHAAALAKLAGLDQAQVLTSLHAEKARPELREIWQEIARRSAVIGLAQGILGGGAEAPENSQTANTRPNMYIMLSRHMRQFLRNLTPWKTLKDPT